MTDETREPDKIRINIEAAAAKRNRNGAGKVTPATRFLL